MNHKLRSSASDPFSLSADMVHQQSASLSLLPVTVGRSTVPVPLYLCPRESFTYGIYYSVLLVLPLCYFYAFGTCCTSLYDSTYFPYAPLVHEVSTVPDSAAEHSSASLMTLGPLSTKTHLTAPGG